MSDIKKVNFFDERYFLYFEEADLCKRLKKKNKKFEWVIFGYDVS